MRKLITAGLVGLLTGATVLTAASSAAGTPGTDGLGAAGLTADGRSLAFFHTERPGDVLVLDPISGLEGDTRFVGIDFRPQDEMIYGVGDQGGIYTGQPGTADALKVGQLSVALEGTSFGVDFNPAANRLRVVSDTGQNLRHNIDDPAAPFTTTVDGTLTTPPAEGAAAGITAAAYTNNDLDAATGTTLFDLSSVTDQVMLQSPANSGQLAATGALTVDTASNAGFDIYSTVRDGVTVANEGYATLQAGGAYGLYRIDLLTGTAAMIGDFGGEQIADIAIVLNQR